LSDIAESEDILLFSFVFKDYECSGCKIKEEQFTPLR